MDFFKRLFFGGRATRGRKEYYIFRVKCKRCGEVIEGRVDVDNDLSVEYGEKEGKDSFFCRKVLMGAGHCYQKIEVLFQFDAKRKLVERKVEAGGEFVEA